MASIKFTGYFVKDLRDNTRPLMGDLLTYCETAEEIIQNGMGRKEADRVCDMLNRGEVEYEHSVYSVICIDAPYSDDVVKEIEAQIDKLFNDDLHVRLQAYLAAHYRPVAG